MSQRRYEITDFEWSIIEPLLPNREVPESLGRSCGERRFGLSLWIDSHAGIPVRIPTQAGRVFRREAGRGSDLKPASIPT